MDESDSGLAVPAAFGLLFVSEETAVEAARGVWSDEGPRSKLSSHTDGECDWSSAI
ncbi:MAG: hypothetical protein ABEI57_00710 [Halapricum sp.]